MADEVLLMVKDYFMRPNHPDDRYDIIGKNVAMKWRDLTKQKMLIAEKIIVTLFHKLICDDINYFIVKLFPN